MICEPRIVKHQKVYENDEEYSIEYIYNCDLCDELECEWKKVEEE